jgi:hypothetical protein
MNFLINNCITNCSQTNGDCLFITTINSLVCNCTEFYTGELCEISVRPCKSYPCLNNGTCVENMADLSFDCKCNENYRGELCEEQIEKCAKESCSNNGNCLLINNEPKCECFNMYSGDKCEIKSQEKQVIENVAVASSVIAAIALVSAYFYTLFLDLSKLYKQYFPSKKDQIKKIKQKKKVKKFKYKHNKDDEKVEPYKK